MRSNDWKRLRRHACVEVGITRQSSLSEEEIREVVLTARLAQTSPCKASNPRSMTAWPGRRSSSRGSKLSKTMSMPTSFGTRVRRCAERVHGAYGIGSKTLHQHDIVAVVLYILYSHTCCDVRGVFYAEHVLQLQMFLAGIFNVLVYLCFWSCRCWCFVSGVCMFLEQYKHLVCEPSGPTKIM